MTHFFSWIEQEGRPEDCDLVILGGDGRLLVSETGARVGESNQP
jgi:hypothetical protein